MNDPLVVSSILRQLDSPLWVVTGSDAGQFGGLVATFVMKASIIDDDPRVLIGLSRQHHTHDVIDRSGRVGLHLLRPDQHRLAAHFGMQSGHDGSKFDTIRHGQDPHNVPILDDCAAWMTGVVEAQFSTGDRTLFLCRMLAGESYSDDPFLTTEAFIASLEESQRGELKAQLQADAERDRAAIGQWRTQ